MYNHLRNAMYFGSITILSFGDWIPIGKVYTMKNHQFFPDTIPFSMVDFPWLYLSLPNGIHTPLDWIPKEKDIHRRKLTRPLKRDYFNRKYIFQPSFFRGHVSFREGIIPLTESVAAIVFFQGPLVPLRAIRSLAGLVTGYPAAPGREMEGFFFFRGER